MSVSLTHPLCFVVLTNSIVAERDQICLAVMEAYCNVLYFTQMTEAMQVQVTIATSNLQLAQRQEQLGQKSHADVIQLEAEHLNAQLKYFIKSCVVRYYNGISYIEQMEF